jgi:tetraacyldisaccharide 4'-kinase
MLKIVLYPFAILYDIITRLRNFLYDTGRRGSIQFEANVIGVGNLTVGGTGKTPHIEYLIRLLKERYKVATLNRGYGRKTKGFLIANETSSASMLGDEPFQYYKKFGKEITVTVGEERALAIPYILMEREETNVILLDDAYQHRSVRPLLTILLSDFNRPFYEDVLLPAGRLRESRKGANRADIVIVSKCPDNLSDTQQSTIRKAISNYAKQGTPVFFTGINYGKPVSFCNKEIDIERRNIVLITGLANAKPITDYLNKSHKVSKHFEFPDHYNYKMNDIETIVSGFNILNENNDHVLITTEKDMVKLIDSSFKRSLEGVPLFYIPIEIYFLKEKDKFDELVFKKGILF